MTNVEELIAAFADGEPVAAGDLKAALAEAVGRDYLIDVLALRRLMNDGVAPADEGRRSARPTRLWLTGVAALIVAGVGIGYLAGRGTELRESGAHIDQTAADAPAIAPAPTHVIRMENGVIWNERAGGN